jgi:hypothetical protein
VREIHTERGTHRLEEIPFPTWVDADTAAEAKRLSEADARAVLAPTLPEFAPAQ